MEYRIRLEWKLCLFSNHSPLQLLSVEFYDSLYNCHTSASEKEVLTPPLTTSLFESVKIKIRHLHWCPQNTILMV